MQKVKKQSRDKAIVAFIPFGEKDRFTSHGLEKLKRSEGTIAKALKMSKGYKNIAAYILRMNPDSLSKRISQSPYLQAIRDDAVESLLYMSESIVYDEIKAHRNWKLALKVLQSLGQKHGWSPDFEALREHMGGPELTINIGVDPEAKDYDEVEETVTRRRRVKSARTIGVIRTRIKKEPQQHTGRKLIGRRGVEEDERKVETETVEQQVDRLRKIQQAGFNRSEATF